MATLTSTGAVNLTSATNWSPAQVPAPGDDLVIGAHTLTLDADLVLGSVTFNNAASRLDFTGPTRTVQATNGWNVTTHIDAQVIVTTISFGTTLTLIGRWTLTGGIGSLFANSGGTVNLRTVGNDPAAILFSSNGLPFPQGVKLCVNSACTAGLFTTTGRFFTYSGGQYASIVGSNGMSWTHTSVGLNTLGIAVSHFSFAGAAVWQWTGDVLINVNAVGIPIVFENNWSGSATFYGNLETLCLSGKLVQFGTGINGTANFVGNLQGQDVLDSIRVTSGAMNWGNQSAALSNGRFLNVTVNGGTFVISGLKLDNAGKVFITRTSGTLVADSATSIENRLPSSQFLVRGTSVLDGRVLYVDPAVPVLPAPEDVAAATVYGYPGFELTGSGLIVDPAIISSAVLAAQLATLQKNTTYLVERTLEDTKALTFGWHSDAETVQGQVSIDNGPYVPVAGAITFLRSEEGKHYYTLAYNAADRPTAEGTARYRFYSDTDSMYANLRVLKASPRVTDIQAGLALETTSQNILIGVTSLHSNDRSEFF